MKGLNALAFGPAAEPELSQHFGAKESSALIRNESRCGLAYAPLKSLPFFEESHRDPWHAEKSSYAERFFRRVALNAAYHISEALHHRSRDRTAEARRCQSTGRLRET